MNLRWTMLGGLLLGGVAGCFAGEEDAAGTGADDVGYMPDDLPAGKCRDTEEVANTDPSDTDGECPDTDPGELTATDTDATGSESTSAATDGCMVSEDCMGGVCIASFDPEAELREPFECEFACLENLDEDHWCTDDASCCDPDATCTERGYCIALPE